MAQTDRERFEAMNENIGTRLQELVFQRDKLDAEIQELQRERISNMAEINRLLKDELDELEKR